MKIAVGTNLFGKCWRQDLAVESLLKCKKKFFNNIDLFNLQFASAEGLTEHDGFKTLKCLKSDSMSDPRIQGEKKLPLVREMFDSLADLNYDYFCFINSDIIVSYNFFEELFTNKHDAYIGSRLAIEGDIKDLNFEIRINDQTSPVRNSHYQVSGFDSFTINTAWWRLHREYFPEYVYAVVYWDTHYATLLLKYADTMMQNKIPTLFHIIHEDRSSAKIKEFYYNQELFATKHKKDFELWHRYFFGVLIRRPGENFIVPHCNEIELQKAFFKQL